MKAFAAILTITLLWLPFYSALHAMDGHREVKVYGSEKDDDLPLCYYRGSNRCNPDGPSLSLPYTPGLVTYHTGPQPENPSLLPHEETRFFMPSPAGRNPFKPPSSIL